MILNLDVKSLEIYVAAYLSQDKTLYRELLDGADIHGINQRDFKLPERVIAKILVFRILYGGTQFSFVKDPDFMPTSTSLKYWEKVIDRFYSKYTGIAEWHASILREVADTGCWTSPFGRSYEWDLYKYDKFYLPETEIKNYPVQGFGADIVAMARCSIFRRFRNGGFKRANLVCTVHDSIVADCCERELDKLLSLLDNVFTDLPSNINRIFGLNFDLPVRVEISVGPDMLNLKEIKFTGEGKWKFVEQ